MKILRKIISPTSVALPRKTKKDKIIHLNLNIYRNLHPMVEHQCKKRYAEILLPEINKLPQFNRIYLIKYLWFPQSSRASDTANVCCIVDKYFCDALVRANKLPDDNHTYLQKVMYEYGSIDRTNPRIEIYIYGDINENSN